MAEEIPSLVDLRFAWQGEPDHVVGSWLSEWVRKLFGKAKVPEQVLGRTMICHELVIFPRGTAQKANVVHIYGDPKTGENRIDFLAADGTVTRAITQQADGTVVLGLTPPAPPVTP